MIGAVAEAHESFITVVMSIGGGSTGSPSMRGVASVRVLAESDEPMSLATGDWRAFIVRIPESIIPASPAGLQRLIDFDDLVTVPAVAGPLVARAWSVFEQSEPEPLFSDDVWWARALGSAVERVAGAQPSPAVVTRARRAQIERIVSRYSSDRRLTPESLASAIGVSRRTLYELAEPPFGGISEFIRTARAIRAAHMLADDSMRHLKAADIASAAGFSSARHMSRALLALGGRLPVALREDLPEVAPEGLASA